MIKLAALAVAAAALVACTGDATEPSQSSQNDVVTTDTKANKRGVEIVADDLQKFGDLSERLDLQPDLDLEQPVDGTPVAAENGK